VNLIGFAGVFGADNLAQSHQVQCHFVMQKSRSILTDGTQKPHSLRSTS
jgi:hypothetical protein